MIFFDSDFFIATIAYFYSMLGYTKLFIAYTPLLSSFSILCYLRNVYILSVLSRFPAVITLVDFVVADKGVLFCKNILIIMISTKIGFKFRNNSLPRKFFSSENPKLEFEKLMDYCQKDLIYKCGNI
jgi:hypothetical protein